MKPFWVLSDPIRGSITSHRRVELHVAAPWDPGILTGTLKLSANTVLGHAAPQQGSDLCCGQGEPEEADCFTAKGKAVSNTPRLCVMVVSESLSRLLVGSVFRILLSHLMAPSLPYFTTGRQNPHI